jgi:DNA-binding Lrp family transcriptional regulator
LRGLRHRRGAGARPFERIAGNVQASTDGGADRLQKAKDAGIISDSEYNRQRTAILNRNN